MEVMHLNKNLTESVKKKKISLRLIKYFSKSYALRMHKKVQIQGQW